MKIAKLNKNYIHQFSKLAKQTILDSLYYSDLAKTGCIKDFNPKNINADLKNKNIILLMAIEKNEKIIGFARGFFDGGIKGGIFWLQWIGTDVKYQKRGIADKMLKDLAKRLQNNYKTHKIVCVIRPKNKASLALFKKNKYCKSITLKKHWYNEDFILLYKYL